MLPKDFFDLVRQMRGVQKQYTISGNWRLLLRMRKLEKKVDEEIEKTIIQANFSQSVIDFYNQENQ